MPQIFIGEVLHVCRNRACRLPSVCKRTPQPLPPSDVIDEHNDARCAHVLLHLVIDLLLSCLLPCQLCLLVVVFCLELNRLLNVLDFELLRLDFGRVLLDALLFIRARAARLLCCRLLLQARQQQRFAGIAVSKACLRHPV